MTKKRLFFDDFTSDGQASVDNFVAVISQADNAGPLDYPGGFYIPIIYLKWVVWIYFFFQPFWLLLKRVGNDPLMLFQSSL